MSIKTKFIFKQDTFSDLLSKVKDISRISDTIKLRIDSESIFIYGLLGTDRMILACKSFSLKTEDYLILDKSIPILNLVVVNSKKLVKNLNLINVSKKIEATVTHKSIDERSSEVRKFELKNDKLKLNFETGESNEIRNIDKDFLNKILDIKNQNWSFKIENSDFISIKNLSSINSDETRQIINLIIKDYKVYLSENNIWELEVDSSTEENTSIMLNKKFLPLINDHGDTINFHVFETFILIKDNMSNFMISFEQTLN